MARRNLAERKGVDGKTLNKKILGHGAAVD